MSTKVNKTAIGIFVLGAIVLLVAGVLVLGGGKFFTTEHIYITYFDGSVKGLSAGSPVMFRGVKVGEVTGISIVSDQAGHTFHIPVIFKLIPSKIKGTDSRFQRDPKSIEKAVKNLGLRTQLQSMSFVTGQLMLSLDFFPDKPARYVGLNPEYTEIPSVPTPLELLEKTLEDLPLRAIVINLNETIKSVNSLVNSINGNKTIANIDATLRDLQAIIKNANNRIDPLIATISKTAVTADAALNETRETMAATRGELSELVKTTRNTLKAAEAALKQSEHTLQAYSEDSQVMTELNKTLRELSSTTRSLRHLSDYLERHPESLLRGKTDVKGD
jgi:paraquat-inducible protein B